MSSAKAFGQFVLGLIGWVIVPIAAVTLLVSVRIFLGSPIYNILFPALFLIGIGLAVFCIRKENWRWFGIGMSVTLALHALGALLAGCGVPPFLLPFPLSMMSGC